MDTSLSLLCNGLLILATLRWSRRPDRTGVALLLTAAFLAFQARPDNLIAAVLFPLALLLWVERRFDRWPHAATYIGLLGLLIVADALLKWSLLGDPLPLAFYAKQYTHFSNYLGAQKWNPVLYLLQILQFCLPFTALAVLLADRRGVGLFVAFSLPALVAWAWYFSVLQIMGSQARFLFPFVPYLVLGGIAAASRRLEDATQGRPFSRSSLVPRVLAVLAFGWLVSIGPRQDLVRAYAQHFLPAHRAAQTQVGTSARARPRLGWWNAVLAMADVARELPSGTRIAMTEYGYIGAVAPELYIVDPLGLHDRWTAHHGFSADRFFADPPDLIWLPHSDYAGLRRAILQHPTFRNEYDFYPGLFDYGAALRRDAPRAGKIRKVVTDQARNEYGQQSFEDFRFSAGPAGPDAEAGRKSTGRSYETSEPEPVSRTVRRNRTENSVGWRSDDPDRPPR